VMRAYALCEQNAECLYVKVGGTNSNHLRDYWVFGLCPLYSNVNNTTFWKLGPFPYSGEGVGDIYSVGFVRKS
jgi:hypothetical protein